MILIGLGANLASHAGPPAITIEAALTELESLGITIVARSPFYESEPVPRSDQPWFVNAAARLQTGIAPEELLVRFHEIEHRFGRERRERNEARPLDLDLLDYDGIVRDQPTLQLPHPRLHERAFVLKPIIDLAPTWRHPLLGRTAAELLATLPEEAQQGTRPLRAASADR